MDNSISPPVYGFSKLNEINPLWGEIKYSSTYGGFGKVSKLFHAVGLEGEGAASKNLSVK
jgi:hypothetical protein